MFGEQLSVVPLLDLGGGDCVNVCGGMLQGFPVAGYGCVDVADEGESESVIVWVVWGVLFLVAWAAGGGHDCVAAFLVWTLPSAWES